MSKKSMPNIFIDTIPHAQQRYETIGDWFKEKDYTRIRISKMNNPDYEFLIAIHEFIEWYLCQKAGITEKEVDEFDYDFKMDGLMCHHSANAEPGDDPAAPYYDEHQFATGIERILAAYMGVDWNQYDTAVNNLT